MTDRVEELQIKRDLTYSLLMSIPHLKCPKPSGAFYLLPDVSHYYGRTLTRQDGSKTVINNGHVSVLLVILYCISTS